MSNTDSPDQATLADLDFQPRCQVDDNPAAWTLTKRCCGHIAALACARCKTEILDKVFELQSGEPGQCIHCGRIVDSAGDNFELRPL